MAGAVAVVGFAPVDWFPLVIASVTALLWLLHHSATPRRGFGLGFAWGLGFFLAGVSWVYVSMSGPGEMAAPLAALATLLFAAFLALFPALVGFTWVRLKTGAHIRDALLFAGLWALIELARGYVFTGFPWLSLGYSQLPPSPLAGFAPWLGIYGVGFTVSLGAGLLLAMGHPQARRGAAVALLLLVATAYLAGKAEWTRPAGKPLTISLLQGNIPQELKWDPKKLALSVDTYTRLTRANPAQLVILPETSIPLLFENIPRETLGALTEKAPLILGAAVGTSGDQYVNAAVALRATEDPGHFRAQLYAKRHLVPFGEYIPPGFAWFFHLVNIPMTGFSVGPEHQSPLLIEDQALWPTVCYEDLFGGEMLGGAGKSTLLLNLSNTAWFGHSLAQPQHLQIARMRTLETGRPMVRATNTGMTAAIAADGRVMAVLSPFIEGALTVTVQGMAGLTPYMRIGDWGALLLALAACGPALGLRRRVAKSTTTAKPSLS